MKIMKNIYRFIVLLLIVSACTDRSMEDVNKNINEVTDADPIYLINSSFNELFNRNSTWDKLADLTNHYAGTSNPSGYYYKFDSGIWGFYIANNNLKDAIKKTEGSQERVDQLANALAKIFRAYGFQRLTDCYGDVPFSEAAELDENDKPIITPKYDKQKDIYYSVLSDLKSAIDVIGDDTNLPLGSSDRVYNGDLQKWKKFANSLRLRMAMRIRFVDGAKALEVLQDVFTKPLIDSEDESAAFKNWDETGYYYYGFNGLKAGTRTNTSKRMVDYLKSVNDPRLPCYALPVVEGVNKGGFDGLPNGYDDNLNRSNFSYCGRVTYQKDLPTMNIMYSEVCFLKAEAYLFGLGVVQSNDEAQQWLKKGVEASLNFWHRKDTYIENEEEVTDFLYTQEDIDSYLVSDAVTLSGNQEEMFEVIAMQKWVALMTNWVEAFAEMRRTGYPAIEVRTTSDVPRLSLGDTNGHWPRRVPYPDSEMLYNKENYDIAKEATDGNSLTYRVWWDVK
ncbi:SusD/RagB family nutrient-binding outer membrane lipoprotein [Prolixibacteraceae bacterium JC049]|nr:SusD/RagB family nutrient-binding outer membrane lipoprotein [Prolixibacteraceae bacterium JC049]